jgi:hypothetical protein
MYKYIIYCSISAVIIIAAKYVYQNWIKQNHTIATIKQDIQLLQTKVKNVEEHFEKTKGSMSGGVTIPITFQKIDNTPPPQQPKQSQPSPVQTKNNVKLSNDLSSSSSTISSLSSDSISTDKTPKVINLSPKKENDNKSVSHSSKSSSKKKILDISDEKSTQKSLEIPLEVLEVLATEEVLEAEALEAPKKAAKKKGLPDAKNSQNGDKFIDDNGVEYLCIVGKRGGHSWKKINL